MKKAYRPMKLALVAGTVLGASTSAWAQFSSNFESPLYNGSTTGTVLANGSAAPGGGGQQDWYIPVAGSFDHRVFTYAGNLPPWATAAIPTNPQGSGQFSAGNNTGGGASNSRGQHSVDFSAGGAWVCQWDQLARFDGTFLTGGLVTNNLGSFSTQLPTVWQNLTTWGANAGLNQDTSTCRIQLGATTPASPGALDTSLLPGAAFDNVPTNHWIRLKYWFNLTTGVFTGASIQDLTAGGPSTTIDLTPNSWGLVAGVPTAVRFFVGGTYAAGTIGANDGNTIAYDNLVIQQATFTATTGACCLPTGTCSNAQTYTQCAAQSGVYRGDAVQCSSVNCPQPGACCFADGTCAQLSTVQCTAQSGVHHGDGTVCGVGAGICPQPGACCLADGTCSSVLATACAARTGVFRGAGILCSAVTCPQPFNYETTFGDAGETRATAPIAIGSGPLPGIIGGSIGTEDVDMYDIQICDPANFRASTVTWTQGGTGAMDTMLFLFNANGVGVVMDDDNPGTGVESTIINTGISTPGRYYLAISGWDRGPLGATTSGRIWATQSGQNSAPNGPGAAEPLGSWTNFGVDPGTGNPAATGFYTIAFNGACYVDHPCYANCDSSTTIPCLNVLDFSCFLNKFAAGDTYANCDNSTTPPVLNVLDFSCFLNKFAAGCSGC